MCHKGSAGNGLSAGRREVLMNQRHDRRAFSDRAADPLHGSRPHVADREYAGHVRRQWSRRLRGSKRVASATGKDEAPRIACYAAPFDRRATPRCEHLWCFRAEPAISDVARHRDEVAYGAE